MPEKKLLLITFDYELFLGEQSGTVEKCLIEPTDRLLDSLGKYGFKAVFFIDTVYLFRLNEAATTYSSAKDDLEAITKQLVKVVESGHEIHPHIHPHWIDAVYHPESNQWSLKQKRYYSFASIPEMQRTELFERSVKLIRSVLDSAKQNQSVDSYRAGGWSIQPFQNFRPLFTRFHISNEWSVIPGKYQISDAHRFDFREAPVTEPVYRFSDDPCRKDENGPFREWTISSLKMNRFEKWIDFKISGLLQRLGKRPAYKGTGVNSVIREEGDKYCPGPGKRVVASFEGLNPFTLRKYISSIRYADYFQFISHPKLITPYEFGMVDKFFR